MDSGRRSGQKKNGVEQGKQKAKCCNGTVMGRQRKRAKNVRNTVKIFLCYNILPIFFENKNFLKGLFPNYSSEKNQHIRKEGSGIKYLNFVKNCNMSSTLKSKKKTKLCFSVIWIRGWVLFSNFFIWRWGGVFLRFMVYLIAPNV